MKFDWNNAIVQGLVVAFLVALGSILYKGLKKSGKSFAGFFLRKIKEKTGLDYYREDLEANTLSISHPWMKALLRCRC